MSFSYQQAHEYLDSLMVFGIKLGLKNMEELCRLLGHPEDRLQFIHVAGTNGKGSSCALLAAGLKGGGFKTGFYSSPFLCNFTERWRIDGLEVSEEQVSRAIYRIAELEPELVIRTGVRPTYFEVLTAAALLIFCDEEVEVVVWETGMGGRLDATNVVKPVLTLITNIGLDHTQYLGDTIEDIAREKAGILKNGVPVVLGELCEKTIPVFEERAKELAVEISRVGVDFSLKDLGVSPEGGVLRQCRYASSNEDFELEFLMQAKYQLCNIGPVVRVLELASSLLSRDFKTMAKAAGRAVWPGRFDVWSDSLILDGAHNVHAVKVLLDSLSELYPDQKFSFICGILVDKEWQDILDLLMPVASDFFIVEVDNVRTSKPEELEAYIKSNGGLISGIGKVQQALDSKGDSKKTVVVGSLYLIGEALSYLNGGEALAIER